MVVIIIINIVTTMRDKSKYKKLYKTLAKTYYPDIENDDGEIMRIVNQLKEDWGI